MYCTASENLDIPLRAATFDDSMKRREQNFCIVFFFPFVFFSLGFRCFDSLQRLSFFLEPSHLSSLEKIFLRYTPRYVSYEIVLYFMIHYNTMLVSPDPCPVGM
jgi:hypothetical protein